MTPRKPTKKRRRRTRKFNFERARDQFYMALFAMRRMDFDIIQALTYATGGGEHFQPSERMLLDLISQSNDVRKHLLEAEELMRPYVKTTLADPEGFRASVLSKT